MKNIPEYEILNYRINTILNLEIVNITGSDRKGNYYYYGYILKDERGSTKKAMSGYNTDLKAMQQGIKALQEVEKACRKSKKDSSSDEVPF